MSTRSFFLLAPLLVAACGPMPVPVDPAERYAQQQHSADDGHDHGEHFPGDGHDHGDGGGGGGSAGPLADGAQAPNDSIHSGMTGGASSAGATQMNDGEGEPYSGVIRLRGELAEVKPSYLFISVMPEESNMPGCFTRLDLGDESVGTLDGEERVIGFHFTSCPIPGGGPVELKVQWDGDGYVNSENDREIAKRYPVARGAQNIDAVLTADDE